MAISNMTIRRPLLIMGIAATVAVLLFLYFLNPVETALAPKCVFHAATGWSCPGCGMQRFLHAMMHGRFLEAIRYNYLLVVLIPYITLYAIQRLCLKGHAQQQWRKVLEGRTVTYALCILAPAWFVIRNILHI
ncbi:MAG: DUF2752 domain-containing protein [Prevotella sp.]|nr:DUF2752 domain-containing protein [Prevotella sp.]